MKWFYIAGSLIATIAVVGGAWLYIASTVETPTYEVIRKDGRFELRAYPKLIVAEAQRPGNRQDAVRSGFQALAGYIFAREREGEKIAMTAPVLQQQPSAENEPWRVSFIMPAGHALETLPAPARDDVALEELDQRQIAAVRFSGSWRDAQFDAREQALRDWMAAQNLEAASPAIYAYYNDPFTPGFLRRNEVMFVVR